MSFGLARDRELSDDGIGVSAAEMPPLPDTIVSDREAGRLDPRRWFPQPARPFEIEIGVGKGTFLVNHVPQHRGTNFLGIEWAHEFYLYSADRLRRRAQAEGLDNIRMLHANAVDFLKWRCPSGIVRVIHLYFSDPWPKKKHHKNRVVQDAFLAEAWRVLEPRGELRVVTDHDELWAWDLDHFRRFTAQDDQPVRFDMEDFVPESWVTDGELVGTNYERKFRRGDRPAHACVLRRRGSQ